MVATDSAAAMKALGLSAYEAQAYEALLHLGAADAGTLGRKAGIPSGRVYSVLGSLEEKRLVRAEGGRPKRFRAAPPKLALQSLLSLERRGAEARYEELTKIAGRLEKQLARGAARDGDSSFYSVFLGDRGAHEFLSGQIEGAGRTIDVNLEFEEHYEPEDRAIFSALSEAAARGVEIRVLIDERDVSRMLGSEFGGVIVDTLLPHLGDGLHVRITERPERIPFSVMDGEKVTIGVKNPVDPEKYFAFVFVWDPKLARDLSGKFQRLWDEAVLDAEEMLFDGR
ncbi:MAG: TrmB family transcriptional regulator [Methanobacteriota archaeon]